MHATDIAAKVVPRVVAPLGVPPIACSTAENSGAGLSASTGDIVGNPSVGSELTGAGLTSAGLTGTGVIGAGLTGDGVVTTASVGGGVEKVLPVMVVVVSASVGPISLTGAELGATVSASLPTGSVGTIAVTPSSADTDAGGRVGVFVSSNAVACFLLAVSVGLSVGFAVAVLDVMTGGLSVGSLLDGL